MQQSYRYCIRTHGRENPREEYESADADNSLLSLVPTLKDVSTLARVQVSVGRGGKNIFAPTGRERERKDYKNTPFVTASSLPPVPPLMFPHRESLMCNRPHGRRARRFLRLIYTRYRDAVYPVFRSTRRVGINVVNCPSPPLSSTVDPGVSLRVITMVCGLSSWLQVQYHFHNDAYPHPQPLCFYAPLSPRSSGRRIKSFPAHPREVTAKYRRSEGEKRGRRDTRGGRMNNKWRTRPGERDRRKSRVGAAGQKNTIKHFAVTQFNEHRPLGPAALVRLGY